MTRRLARPRSPITFAAAFVAFLAALLVALPATPGARAAGPVAAPPEAPRPPQILVGDAPARGLRLLTFNVEHHMSAERFGRWKAFCEPAGWRDPEPGTTRRPADLNYCNALDGTDGRGKRLFAPVRTTADWQRKREQLRQLIASSRPDVVLLQEVSDSVAAADLLGADYRVISSAELWRDQAIAQNIAIAWRDGLPFQTGKAELLAGVAQAGADGHMTRPGLAMTFEIGDTRRLTIVNLHLKAGCRKGRLDESPSRKPDRAERRQNDCSVFQRQVPALEAWVDAKLKAGNAVIVAGDLNRDVLDEIREKLPARTDGGDAAATAPEPARIASLLAELSDSDPPAAWFAVARPGPYPKGSECHRAIDNFLISRNLEPWLDRPLRQLSARVIPFAEPVALDRVRPSDHCPHLLELRFPR